MCDANIRVAVGGRECDDNCTSQVGGPDRLTCAGRRESAPLPLECKTLKSKSMSAPSPRSPPVCNDEWERHRRRHMSITMNSSCETNTVV